MEVQTESCRTKTACFDAKRFISMPLVQYVLVLKAAILQDLMHATSTQQLHMQATNDREMPRFEDRALGESATVALSWLCLQSAKKAKGHPVRILHVHGWMPTK